VYDSLQRNLFYRISLEKRQKRKIKENIMSRGQRITLESQTKRGMLVVIGQWGNKSKTGRVTARGADFVVENRAGILGTVEELIVGKEGLFVAYE